MTVAELAGRLAPIARTAIEDDDPIVVQVGIVLAAVMGCIDGGEPFDRDVLAALAAVAVRLCRYRENRPLQPPH